MKTYGGGGEWSTSHHSHHIPGKEPQYPLNRRLGALGTIWAFWRS